MEKKEVNMEKFIHDLIELGMNLKDVKVCTSLAVTLAKLSDLGYCISLSSEKPTLDINDLENVDLTLLDVETGVRYDLKTLIYYLNKVVNTESGSGLETEIFN